MTPYVFPIFVGTSYSMPWTIYHIYYGIFILCKFCTFLVSLVEDKKSKMHHINFRMTGLFIDFQPWIIAHGKMNAIFGTILHFLTRLEVMAVASIAVDLQGSHFVYWNCANGVFSYLWYDQVPIFSLFSLLFVETYIKRIFLSVFVE